MAPWQPRVQAQRIHGLRNILALATPRAARMLQLRDAARRHVPGTECCVLGSSETAVLVAMRPRTMAKVHSVREMMRVLASLGGLVNLPPESDQTALGDSTPQAHPWVAVMTLRPASLQDRAVRARMSYGGEWDCSGLATVVAAGRGAAGCVRPARCPGVFREILVRTVRSEGRERRWSRVCSRTTLTAPQRDGNTSKR